MALTEEIKTLLGDKVTEDGLVDMLLPEAQTKLAATHVIRTKEDDDTYVNTQVDSRFDAKIGEKIKEIHQKYEDDIFEITGLRKKPTEKAYDFNKRLLADLKVRAENTGGDQALKDQIATLTETLSTKELEHTTALTKVQDDAFKEQLKVIVKAEFDNRNIDIPVRLTTDAEKQKYINDQKRLLEKDFLDKYTPKKDNEGNIIYYLGDKPQLDTATGKALTASALISTEYGSYFSTTGKKVTGTGSKGEGVPEGGFTTTAQVYEHLKERGLEMHSQAFNKEAGKLIKEHGIIIE